ncbi:hypothetical protein [Kutzneria sp. NPDC052558]|uniref:hypothetical protein n=1 Tax=Kutzneria sp. NPDC052558 TaxID=3364121 RepID=UPI0037CAB1CC
MDRLREAMAQPPAEQFAEVDVERVMRLGSRRRTGRRLLTAAAAVLAFMVVAGSVIGVRMYRDAREGATFAMTASHPAAIDAAPFGPVIDTGVVDNPDRVVLYFAPVQGGAGYQLVLAHESDDGKLRPVSATAADLGGSGFRGVTTGHPQTFLPLYGSFVGPAAQFKAVYQGEELTVHSQLVPELNVTVFWAEPKYDAEDIGATSTVQLSAFDANGNLLTSGSGPAR